MEKPNWPEIKPEHPLSKLQGKLRGIVQEAQHNEIWGVTLTPTAPFSFSTYLILQKFLRANADDVEKAATQLQKTLEWRREFKASQTKDETFSATKFGGLGYITAFKDSEKQETVVTTWNIYGAVKDNNVTFGDVDAFLRWRVAVMEASISHLALSEATKPIPDYGAGPDPYQMVQVHDYLSVSFLRMDPAVKAASKRAIETFQNYYPELLERKFFVNVPIIMGWMFAAMKVFLAEETKKKFVVLSYGNQVAAELGDAVPKTYGGTGEELAEVGEAVKLEADN